MISLCLAAAAARAQDTTAAEDVKFRTTVSFVVAPVTVLDKGGAYYNGLQPNQFRLFDNGKEQDIKVDVHFQPISLVVAVQANAAVESVLPQVQKIGGLIQPLVMGDQGQVALVAFDHRIRVLQDFTSDGAKFSEALQKIKPGSSSSRLIDAVMESTRMLRRQPKERRRVLLIVSETRDISSSGRIKDALLDLELANISVYTVNISRAITTISGKGAPPPRPDPYLPGMRPMPAGVPSTPTSVAQSTGNQGGTGNVVPLLVEIFRDVKAVFRDNPAEAFTKGTGGAEFSFVRQRGLEEAISRIGEELHSQYMITYSPNNTSEGGFHEITVSVIAKDAFPRTRPGYWLATVQ